MEEPWCCSDSCHSKQHGDVLTSIIMESQLSDKEVAAFLMWKCNNFAAITNSTGQSLLQISAGTGRLKLLRFLLNKCNNLNDNDKKFGDSALHISLYYGMIHVAVRLIQFGSHYSLNIQYLTPLDLVMIDTYNTIEIDKDYINDVYVWGSNTNYNLGCGHNRERNLPELHDYFYKNKISIVKTRIEKFHSIYLDSCGIAWGSGLGIRAGLGSDSAILLPRKVFTDTAPVISISTSEQHTVFLLETGIAYTCGFNTYSVLGHSQQPETLAIPKPVRGLPPLKGVCAAPFHSVFYSDTMLFTCGKNYGQLGHSDEKGSIIVAPRAVNAIKMNTSTYQCVAASAGATVVLNSIGSVYLLSNFRCTRITPRPCLLQGKMVGVIGGPADISDTEIRVVLITVDNILHVYRSANPEFVQCTYSIKRELIIYDIILNSNGCLFTTTLGEGFFGKFEPVKLNESEQLMEVERIPHIYRGRGVSSDCHGRNMAVIQINPLFEEKSHEFQMPNLSPELFINLKTLTETATTDDSIHDVIFQFEGQSIAAHSFIIFHGNEYYSMSKLAVEQKKSGKMSFNMSNLPVEAFRSVLTWLYSMKCPFCSSSVLKNNCYGHNSELGSQQKSDLQLVASKLGIVNFMKALRGEEVPMPHFDRNKGFHDAELEADDGMRLFAHKCILVARSLYFSAMLTHGWNEAGKIKLKVPVSGRIMLTLVDFMYNASTTSLEKCDDVEFIIQVMVDADKLLFEDVITIATHRLLTLMNLRNVADILHFGIRYHNSLLITEARLFIFKNLPAILESRVLEGFPDEYLEDLTNNYLNSFLKNPRKMTHLLDPLDVAIIQSLSIAHPVNIDLELDIAKEESHSKKKKKGKKISDRVHRISEGGNEEVNVTMHIETVLSPKLNENESKPLPKLSETPSRFKPISPEKVVSTPENLVLLTKKTENILLEDFPDLNTKRQYKTPPKTSAASVGESSKKFVKLSQRERRRLASVTSSDGETPLPVAEHTASPRSPWAPLPPVNSMLAQSPENPIAMKAIINEEKFEKERTARMKNKPLALTQIEDRALRELEVFYNVANATDERITVERLKSIVTAAPPVWPVNRKNISL